MTKQRPPLRPEDNSLLSVLGLPSQSEIVASALRRNRMTEYEALRAVAEAAQAFVGLYEPDDGYMDMVPLRKSLTALAAAEKPSVEEAGKAILDVANDRVVNEVSALLFAGEVFAYLGIEEKP